MARGREITCVGYFVYPDGHTVPWDSLSYEEKLEINKEWIRRWESTLPQFYKDPKAFAALPDVTPEEEERYYQLFPEKRKLRQNNGGT